MVEPKTIDKLPIETSVEYAQQEAFRQPELLRGAGQVAAGISREINVPTYESAVDLLVESYKKNLPFSLFTPVKGYEEMGLFSHEFLTSVPPAQIEASLERVQSVGKTSQDATVEKERGKLVKLLQTIASRAKDFYAVEGQIRQYYKA